MPAWKKILESPCQRCGMKHWMILKYINRGGHETYPIRCGNCGNNTATCIPKTLAYEKGFNDQDPVYATNIEVCEVCGSVGAEFHHWAPYHLFGQEANRWPTSYLCVECHNRWHKTVTPNMRMKKRDF